MRSAIAREPPKKAYLWRSRADQAPPAGTGRHPIHREDGVASGRFSLLMGVGASVLLTGLLVLAQAPAPSTTSQDAEFVKDFEGRVAQYMKMRTQEAGKSPKPTASADKLADNREHMSGSLRDLRAGARQGDIFTEPITQYFRRQIATTLHGPQGAKVRASLKHAEPLGAIPLKVNEPYPQTAPLQSTPPSLLLNLPTLPKELQYRIVGDDLVLLDTAPNIVVDFISHVVPQP
jgi:hypothetical protein